MICLSRRVYLSLSLELSQEPLFCLYVGTSCIFSLTLFNHFAFLIANDGMFAFSVDKMKAGATLTLKKAKIDMFKGSMRLAVDGRSGGAIEESNPADFTVREDNNLSLIEFELVNVVEG